MDKDVYPYSVIVNSKQLDGVFRIITENCFTWKCAIVSEHLPNKSDYQYDTFSVLFRTEHSYAIFYFKNEDDALVFKLSLW